MLDKLNLEIEQRALEDGSYIDAIISFCEEKEIYDYEDVTSLLHPVVLEKLKAEYKLKRYFPDNKIKTKLSNFFE